MSVQTSDEEERLWFLSLYMTPSGLPRLLNIWLRHDCAVALWRTHGSRLTLVRYWEIERLSGAKEHGQGFATTQELTTFLDGLLAEFQISLDDIEEIWGLPELEKGSWSPARTDGLAIHAVSHIYSSLMLDTGLLAQSPVIAMAVDGGPDEVLERRGPHHWYAAAVHRPGAPLEWFAIESPGMLYFAARRRFNRREGTLMALASATPHRLLVEAGEILRDARFDGRNVERVANGILARICQVVDDRWDDVLPKPSTASFDEDDLRVSVCMKIVDEVCRIIMSRTLAQLHAASGLSATESYLSLSGGYALNCPTNSWLLDEFGYLGLLSPPCVNDSGQALGLGLWGFAERFGGHEAVAFAFQGPYLGGKLDATIPDDCDSFVADVVPATLHDAVHDLEAEPVIWMQDRSEIGPRALGNRSLLADPRRLESRRRLNEAKRREWWRPVAPIVMEEHAQEWFGLSRPSPYMLEAVTIPSMYAPRIPAVCHLDGSARVQTVSERLNPRLHALLRAFYEKTGVPVLCNTSLNDAGEPIAETLRDGLIFARRRGFPICYAEDLRISVLPDVAMGMPIARRAAADFFEKAAPVGLFETLNPSGLSDEELYLYLKTPLLRSRFDITERADALQVREALGAMFNRLPDRRDSTRAGMLRRALPS